MENQETERIDALHREATSYKDKKEWEKAIICLREADSLKNKTSTIYPIKHYLRLPLFLQQAGRFDESMQEFEKLINESEQRVLSWLPKRNISSKKMLIHAELYEIYKAISTACKREKLLELSKKYLALHEKHKAEHRKLMNNKK